MRIMAKGNFTSLNKDICQKSWTFIPWEDNSSFQVLRLRENCEENRMICERFLSDYREIFEAQPRKSRDNHSKTSNRASCVPNCFPEKAQNLKCAFSWALFSVNKFFTAVKKTTPIQGKWSFLSLHWLPKDWKCLCKMRTIIKQNNAAISLEWYMTKEATVFILKTR